MTIGRPTDFTEEKASLILALMVEGLSIKKICEQPEMPDPRTIFRWLSANETFRHNYAKAQQDRTTAFAEEMLEIADQYDNLSDKLDVEHIQRARLRIDTRKWLMSKMDPKRYGDKLTQEHTGADGGPVQFTTIYENGPKPGTS
jgi:hypothetical protein